MSNDITPNRPVTAAMTIAIKSADKDGASSAEVAKPVLVNIPDPQETRRKLQEASDQLNQQMLRNSRDLSFSVDDVANKVVMTVKHREGEVVRQIPNEVALRVAHNLENIKGLMQDGKS